MKEKPKWLFLVEKWGYILYVRDCVLSNPEMCARADLRGAILDIGCGRRGWLSLLVKCYFDAEVTTTDIVREKVRESRDIARSLGFESNNYVVADCNFLPFRPRIFDRLVGNAVLHHVLPTIHHVARELFRVLRKDGKGIFTGEIVASRPICWSLKKMILDKAEGEGITCIHGWKEPFMKSRFEKVTILREKRCGYVTSIIKNIFYSISKYLPSKICTDFLVTSCTIIFDK